MELTRRGRNGHTPLLFASNILIWISAVIVMGILSYELSLNRHQGRHLVYEEVISVLTVAFFLLSFFIGAFAIHLLTFNLIFSYLWLVAVAFTTDDYTHSNSALLETVEAFSYIAFFCLLFNVIHERYIGYDGARTTTTSRV